MHSNDEDDKEGNQPFQFRNYRAPSVEPHYPFPRTKMDLAKARIATLTRQLRSAEGSLVGSNLTISRLEKCMKALHRKCDALRDESDTGARVIAESLHCFMTRIIQTRVDVDTHGLVIDPMFLSVCFILQSYSHTGYEFLGRYLPLPDRKTIYRRYKPRINELQTYLSDVAFIPNIVTQRGCEIMFGPIAVDAVSLDSTWVSNRAEKASDRPAEAFLYERLPFTTDAKCCPVHVMAAHSGNATEENCCRANELAGILEGMEPSFKVLFIATDGDNGYNGKYREQFDSWIDD
jgi:hypothetical protein